MYSTLITHYLLIVFIFFTIFWLISFILYHMTIVYKHGSILIRVCFMSNIFSFLVHHSLFFSLFFTFDNCRRV
jgi:hypothetical protein